MRANDPNEPFAFQRKPDLKRVILCSETLILILLTAVTACEGDPDDGGSEVPEIVEVFACSDYCPGAEEKYLKRIYDGVTDEKECRKLGGKPYTYIGWGQRTVCEVQ